MASASSSNSLAAGAVSSTVVVAVGVSSLPSFGSNGTSPAAAGAGVEAAGAGFAVELESMLFFSIYNDFGDDHHALLGMVL